MTRVLQDRLVTKLKDKFNGKEIGFRVLLAALGAHIIVLNGHIESFIEALAIPSYYRAFLPSFIFAYLLSTWVATIHKRLDRHYLWEKNALIRLFHQVLWCFILPLLLNLGFAALYFKAMHGLNLRDTSFLESEIRIIFIMLLFLNFYLVAVTLYQQVNLMRKPPLADTPNFQESHAYNPIPEVYMVKTATASIPLKTNEIAYFYRLQQVNFVRCFNGTDYLVSESLKELERLYGGKAFFRINRQMLVSFESCQSYSVGDKYGSLALTLQPPLSKDDAVTVSEDRAQDFQQWMDR